MAIPVFFTVFEIVLVVVTDQVIESHAIVGGDEIDAKLSAFVDRTKFPGLPRMASFNAVICPSSHLPPRLPALDLTQFLLLVVWASVKGQLAKLTRILSDPLL